MKPTLCLCFLLLSFAAIFLWNDPQTTRKEFWELVLIFLGVLLFLYFIEKK